MALVKIITGGMNSGKTSLALRMIKEMRESGMKPAGFISEAEYAEGSKNKYYIRDISGERRVLAVSKEPVHEGMEKYDFSRFFFSQAAFDFARDLLRSSALSADAVFIDEMGPLELSGRGCFPAVYKLLQVYSGTVVIIIREHLLVELAGKLGIRIEDAEIIRPETFL